MKTERIPASQARADEYDPQKDGHDSYYAAIEAKRLRGDAVKVNGLIRITFSVMPPSANSMRAHSIVDGKIRSFKSKEYAAWKNSTAWEIKAARPGRIDGPYRLYIAAQRNWRSKHARDVDNIIKPTSDVLVLAGIVTDDSLAEEVSAKWADDLGGPAVVVLICKAEGELAA